MMRRSHTSGSSARRQYRPSADALESRCLAAAGSDLTTTPRINPALLQQFVNTLYGPVTAPDGQVYPVPQPTPAEVKREEFVSSFVGTYTIGPPRSTDRGRSIRIFSNGNDAGSNQYSKGRAQLLILPPADPNAQPNPETDPIAGMVVGIAAYIPSNYLQSSADLLFDLTNLPGVASNDPSALSHGLPSRLQWTLDLAGAGVYTQPVYAYDTLLGTSTPGLAPGGAGGATAWTQGTGIVTLKYIPDPKPQAGTFGSGQVIVKLEGIFNNPGILSPIAKSIN